MTGKRNTLTGDCPPTPIHGGIREVTEGGKTCWEVKYDFTHIHESYALLEIRTRDKI